MEAKQFKTWVVCQVCGRTAPADEAPHWLNQPHRERWDIRIVRCPQHWSEWALRHTREGRTNANRAAMAEALAQPAPVFPPYASPFPLRERDDEEVTEVRVGMRGLDGR